MSSDRSEFIIDGDATKMVAEFYRIEEAIKRVKAEMKKAAADTKNDAQTVTATLHGQAAELIRLESREKELASAIRNRSKIEKQAAIDKREMVAEAQIYQLQELDSYRLASAEMESINQQRIARIEAARAAHNRREHEAQMRQNAMTAAFAGQLAAAEAAAIRMSGGLAGSARGANRFRDVMGQASYAVNDFLSVSGGLAERMRAVANNIQYAAMMIPGPWGIGINVLTMAAQAAVTLWAVMSRGDEATTKHASNVKGLADFYKELADDVNKARLGEERFNEQQRRNEFLKQIEPTTKRLDKINAEVSALDQEIAPLEEDMAYYDREGLAAPKERKELKRLKDHRESLKIEEGLLRTQLDDVTKLHDKREDEFRRKERIDAAEKNLGPARDSLAKAFTEDMKQRGEGAARANLAEIIKGHLADPLKSVAGDIAKEIAERAIVDERGKQIAAQFNLKSPLEAQLEAKQRELELAKLEKDETRLKMNADGRLDPLETKALKSMENFIDGLEIVVKRMKMAVDDEKEGKKAGLIQGPIQQVPPQPNRNGNL
jgi:uncharacterized protein YacL (UPF0231 family)